MRFWVSVTDRRGKATTYTFDPRFRVLTESISVSGTMRTVTYGYDPVGNRNAVTDRQGNRTDYTSTAPAT